MVLNLVSAKKSSFQRSNPIFLSGYIALFLKIIWYVKSNLYIRLLCVFIFYFYVSFTMICCQARWFALYFNAKWNVRFAILYFHVFDKMTIKIIKKKKKKRWSCRRTNVEDYYYVSKLHSSMGFQRYEELLRCVLLDLL